ncbi:mCG1042575, partial [Mus musculus]
RCSFSRVSAPLLACAQLARKNDAATGSFCTCLFSPVSSCLYLPCFYLPCLYLPRTLGLSFFYTLSSHPRTAGHATSPDTQLQLIRAAGAYLHQNGFTGILVHLRSSQDVCGLYEEVMCKSYDLAAVPGAFGTAATPAPHNPTL